MVNASHDDEARQHAFDLGYRIGSKLRECGGEIYRVKREILKCSNNQGNR